LQAKTCDNRLSMDGWDFKECKKMPNHITLSLKYFGKYGL
jgi:hypothetical protein